MTRHQQAATSADRALFDALVQTDARARQRLALEGRDIWMLEALAHDPDSTVREALAGNPLTPTRVLRKLANDDTWKVRAATATNWSTPAPALELLTTDCDERVRSAALTNPSLPEHTRQ